MTSYLVYLLALQNIFPGINKNDRFGEVQPGVYNCFPQLEMIESEKHFCRVNDGFTFTVIRRLHDEMERRISNEVADEIAKYGNWYIQFQTFTYVRVSSFHGYPWKLPHYPSYKLLLLELCRQIVQVTRQFGDRCLDFFKFPITIGNYSCADLEIAKSAELDVAHL